MLWYFVSSLKLYQAIYKLLVPNEITIEKEKFCAKKLANVQALVLVFEQKRKVCRIQNDKRHYLTLDIMCGVNYKWS